MSLEQLVNINNLSSPVISVATGSGHIVKSSVAAGADLIIALNAGVYRMQALVHLPRLCLTAMLMIKPKK